MENIKKIIIEHKSFIKYLMVSVFVTIIDIITSRIFEYIVPIVYANSIGIITGFIIQYFMTSKYVYNKNNPKVFLKFFATFILGFILADIIVYICRVLVFESVNSFIAFAVSKGFSIVIPFFVMYFIRKRWIEDKN